MMNQMKCICNHMETARLASRMHVVMNSLQNKLKESGGKASPKDALTSILDKLEAVCMLEVLVLFQRVEVKFVTIRERVSNL